MVGGGRGGGGGQPGGAGAQNARGGTGATPTPPRHVELRNLATGTVQSWQDIQSFTFAATSSHIVLRRRAPGAPGAAAGGRGGNGAGPGGGAPGAPGGGANADAPTGPRGADVILHDLVTGRDQLLGSVGEIGFNKKGDLLAYTVDGTVRDGNGLFILDLRNGRISTLDNDARVYSRLTWNDEGTGLAVLKGVDVDKMRERDNMLLAYPSVQSALDEIEYVPVKFDPSKADGFPKGWVLSDRAAIDWSDDNKRIFFGAKEQVPAPDTTRRRNARRSRGRGRLELEGRADSVGADDPRRRGPQLHLSRGVQHHGSQVRDARRHGDARGRGQRGRPLGRGARHARLRL